ncbi:DUF3575 domain-containing protein [Parabacteroides sp. OttesenSCG-928-N08]|nr:DUF3575 domain-containing protein [Parabacteroides sp. OttesenSCG-928-N08]
MNKIGLAVLLCIILAGKISAQSVALKTNLLYDLTTSPNIGVEMGVNRHITIDVSVGTNPWMFPDNKSLQHVKLQTEFRYWPLERMFGHFFGVYTHQIRYDLRKFDYIPSMIEENHRFDGIGFGGGISYGYSLYLSPRWNLEFVLGGGFTYLEYDKHQYGTEGTAEYLGRFRTNYFGVNRIGVSIVYIIK